MDENAIMAERIIAEVDPYYQPAAKNLLYGLLLYERINKGEVSEYDLYSAAQKDADNILRGMYGWNNFFLPAAKGNEYLTEFAKGSSPQERRDVAAALLPSLTERVKDTSKTKKITGTYSYVTPKKESDGAFASETEVNWYKNKFME